MGFQKIKQNIKMKGFYMLYVEDGDSPKFRHQNLDSAETEARRLAKLLNKKVYILYTKRSISIDIYKYEEALPDDELPF